MTSKDFFHGVTNDHGDLLGSFLGLLHQTGSNYCVIGGLAVNAYAEPVVSLDLDVVIALAKMDDLLNAAREVGMKAEPFEHSWNLSVPDSDLRIQLQIDSRYQEFLARAQTHLIFSYEMQVASIEDVLQGKTWAYLDATRRPSKRQKDLADILRLVENAPELRERLPDSIKAFL